MTDYSTLKDWQLTFKIAERLGLHPNVRYNRFDEIEVRYHPLLYDHVYDVPTTLRYATDAGKALTLLEDACYNFSYDAPSKTCIVRIVDTDNDTDYQSVYSVHAKSIARAICECWLEWMDAKEGVKQAE